MLMVPLGPVRAETFVSNSRFIACLAPVDGAAEARAFIAGVRAEFPDATHHVPAYLLGGGATSAEYCSDDGEPSGTAGRPLLAVLKGSGLGDATIVVVRYFGGTLLGTGGLVKAYAEAGRLVLARVERASLVESCRLSFSLAYPLYDRFRLTCPGFGAIVVEEAFAESVSLVVDLPLDARADFEARLISLSSGAVRPALVARGRLKIPLAGA